MTNAITKLTVMTYWTLT